MPQKGFSTKYELISKDQTRTVAVAAFAAVVLALSFVYSSSLFAKMNHQGRIIEAQESALEVLRDNKNALQSLETSFEEFLASVQLATRDDKTNLDTVRDALPSVYNYPNLLVAMDNLFRPTNYTVRVNATNQEEQVTKVSSNPVPEELPLSFTVTTTEDDLLDVFDRLHRSIRPIQIKQVTISRSGNEGNNVSISLQATTYFLPKKQLEIDTEEIE